MAPVRTRPIPSVRRMLARLPRSIRIALTIAILLPLLALTNLAYHVIRKPTELFFFVGHRLDKEPAETWRQYGALFRTYSTGTITPELLAALAQVESSGNPVDRTYWRWRWSFNPFAIYQPASSANRCAPPGCLNSRPAPARQVIQAGSCQWNRYGTARRIAATSRPAPCRACGQQRQTARSAFGSPDRLSLIHISEPTRQAEI